MLDVEKDALMSEPVGQAIVDPSGEAAGVLPPIADENAARHPDAPMRLVKITADRLIPQTSSHFELLRRKPVEKTGVFRRPKRGRIFAPILPRNRESPDSSVEIGRGDLDGHALIQVEGRRIAVCRRPFRPDP